MKTFLIGIALWPLMHQLPAYGADCPADNPTDIETSLISASNCEKAVQLFKICSIGNSLDMKFGAIVVQKCEQSFKLKLSSAQKAQYEIALEQCEQKYRSREGTLYRSFSALCKADVALQHHRQF